MSIPIPTEIPRTHRRFDRAARLLGDEGLARLASSTATVIGLGGVGSFAAEALCRSGVGRLILVDFDRVCVTNTNRQLHAMKGTLGKHKVDVMAERLRAINPDAVVETRREFYSDKSADRLLTPEPDVVVDAIDNVSAKLHLIATCIRQRLRLVSSMGAAARLDPSPRAGGRSRPHPRRPVRPPPAQGSAAQVGHRLQPAAGRAGGLFRGDRRAPRGPLAYDSGGLPVRLSRRAQRPARLRSRQPGRRLVAVRARRLSGMTLAATAVQLAVRGTGCVLVLSVPTPSTDSTRQTYRSNCSGDEAVRRGDHAEGTGRG